MQGDNAQEKESEKHETQEEDLQLEMSEKMQEVATQEEEKGEEKVQENQAEEEESGEETQEDVPEEEKSEERESEKVEMEHEETLGKEFNDEFMEEEVEEKVDMQKDEAKMDESEETQEDEFKELQSEKESIEDESKEAGWQEEEPPMNHLQNNLHYSSLRADTPRVDPKFDSSNRIFVPKSQDANTEEQDGKLLSELQRNGSFDVEKSLAETQTFSTYNFSNLENSFMTTGKMRAAMNDEEQEDEELLLKSLFSKPVGIHAASTPKSGNSASSPQISKSWSGRKSSVSSRCSLLQFIMKDADNQQVEDTGSDVDGGVSKLNSEAKESAAFLTCNESWQNETTTESLKTEDKDKERDAIYTSLEDVKLLAKKKEMELEDRGIETSEVKEEDMIWLVQDEETSKEEMYEDSPIDLS